MPPHTTPMLHTGEREDAYSSDGAAAENALGVVRGNALLWKMPSCSGICILEIVAGVLLLHVVLAAPHLGAGCCPVGLLHRLA